MHVNVGEAKSQLSKLLARVEAGEDVVISRNGTPVARLVRVEPLSPGQRLLAARGSLAGEIVFHGDFEWTDEEIEELFYSDDG